MAYPGYIMSECLRAERTRKRSRDIDPVAECFAFGRRCYRHRICSFIQAASVSILTRQHLTTAQVSGLLRSSCVRAFDRSAEVYPGIRPCKLWASLFALILNSLYEMDKTANDSARMRGASIPYRYLQSLQWWDVMSREFWARHG